MRLTCLGLTLCLMLGCDEDPARGPVDLGSPRDQSPGAEGPRDAGLQDHKTVDAATDDDAHDGAPGPDSAPQPDTKPVTSELLLYDGKNLQFTTADNGFDPLIKPGDPLPASNWESPKDYYNGEFRIRYVIQAPSTQVAGLIQTCIWTMGNADGDGKDYFPESCADQVAFSGTGEFLGQKLVVSAWWKNANVPLVFAHPERFLIRTVLRGPSGCNITTYNVTGSCWNLWPDYQNMQYRVTIVMLAKGDTFSGWSNYP